MLDAIFSMPATEWRGWIVSDVMGPLGFGAIVRRWTGVADGVIGISNRGFMVYPRALSLFVARTIPVVMDELGVWRLSVAVDSRFCERRDWILRIPVRDARRRMRRFKHEGRMRMFGPDGSDWDQYALVID
jgi:hypothetical protein